MSSSRFNIVLYAYYEFSHNFRIPFTTQQISNARIALKGWGEAIFCGQQLKGEMLPAEQLNGKKWLRRRYLRHKPRHNKKTGVLRLSRNRQCPFPMILSCSYSYLTTKVPKSLQDVNFP
jgi:hypothetical protein